MNDEVVLAPEQTEQLRKENRGLTQLLGNLHSLTSLGKKSASEAQVMHQLQATLASCCDALSSHGGSLLVLDEDSGELVFVLCHGECDVKLKWQRIRPGLGIAGWVIQQARSAIVNDPLSDNRFFVEIDEQMDFRTRSVLAVPLLSNDHVVGVIELVNKHDQRLFTHEDQIVLELAGFHASNALATIAV